jgi:hypothetical protein
MNIFKTLISTFLIIFLSPFVQGQDTTSTFNLTGGKWTVCTDMKFSKDYQCDKGYTSYEFFKNETFKEDRQPIYMGKKMPYVPGKWTLVGNTLTIDEDDDKYHKAFPNVYNIIWLDSNRFYATGQEGPGGPTVYTYFQRTK